MSYKLRDYQQKASDTAVAFFNDKKAKYNAIMVLPTGCHAKGSRVIMADGTLKAVEDVKVGDFLLGDDGSPREVLELHTGVDKMYQIIPIKGKSFIVNGGHILSLYKTNEGKSYPSCAARIDEITVEDYLRTSKNYKHLHKLHRPPFIEFQNSEELELSPYFLGLYLGDGSSSNGSVNITTMREEVKNYLYSFAENVSMHVRDDYKGGTNKAHTYHIIDRRKHRNVLQNALEELGLLRVTCAFKFIPHKYKVSSKENRLQILAGLLDTDAWYSEERNTFEYCSKSRRLSEDVVFLCRSLGFYAMIGTPKVVNGETYYRIQISGELDKIPTKVAIRRGKPRYQKKSVLVTGFSVKYVGQGNYYGFTLDGNHLYCDNQFFVHHNSGKSLVIADIANRLQGHTLVFQPSKEILEQNYMKLCSYGVLDCSVYSASFNSKNISRITFATIGSVIRHIDDFQHFNNIIIDECHFVNAKGGMYEEFIHAIGCKVLGLTATPYRLSSNGFGAMLKFLTRTRPLIFSKIIYQVQISTLLDMGFLSKIDYFQMNPLGWNEDNLQANSTGADYTDKSVKMEYERIDFYSYLVSIVQRLLNPKRGGARKGILVFTRFVKEAQKLADTIPNCAVVSGETSKAERERILTEFKSGNIPVVANVGVLTTGFDFPELDTVVMARPTMSLAMYYQIVGREIRPCKDKQAWFVDLCGNINRFGKVEDLKLIDTNGKGKWAVFSNGKQLTNVLFQ